ncbi:Pyrroline-5-carboxylate reductase [Bremerella volcania]|uniref:Pyrroline-5-carboxylate reductase n=1 Tax=Bremerella volcania TaxID=2527984 RepID=A0A518C6Y4_9BACT|nr:pyrroline-5-carboxylate reductase [Bremerella volcania]QDU74993.1 Pyrroline-5-carboxylate reductase [Bremerella volcania]
MSTNSPRIGFLGAGQMALAMAHGFVARGGVPAANILAADPFEQARTRFAKEISGAKTTASNQEVIDQSDVVILAVKPQMMADAAKSLTKVPGSCLLISIAAGISLDKLNSLFSTKRIIRVMPNTPCLVGLSACAFSANEGISDEDVTLTKTLLEATGIAVQVPEKQLDAVTGLSGSGPAFVYMMIEAMSDAGVRQGLPRAVALQLAAQTVKGAAEMVLATGQHPAALKDNVTSPGGTTIAGVHELEKKGFRGAVIDAISAAAERSKELGQD